MKKVIKLTENDLHQIVRDSVMKILKESNLQETRLKVAGRGHSINENLVKKNYFVVDEGDGFYNPFTIDMFDNDGWLEGYRNQQGYNIKDMDIACYCNSWEEACRKADELQDFNN